MDITRVEQVRTALFILVRYIDQMGLHSQHFLELIDTADEARDVARPIAVGTSHCAHGHFELMNSTALSDHFFIAALRHSRMDQTLPIGRHVEADFRDKTRHGYQYF